MDTWEELCAQLQGGASHEELCAALAFIDTFDGPVSESDDAEPRPVPLICDNTSDMLDTNYDELLHPVAMPMASGIGTDRSADHPHVASKPMECGEDDTSDERLSCYLTQRLDETTPSTAIDDIGKSDETQVRPPLQPQQGLENPTTKPRARRRDHKREELLYLRAKVAELEAKLESMQEAERTHESKSFNSPIKPLEVNIDPLALPSSPSRSCCSLNTSIRAVWEEVATRQRQQRRQALLENRALRTMLEEQVQVAKTLEALLAKKRSHDEFLGPATAPIIKRMQLFSDSAESGSKPLVDEFFARLVEMYAEVDVLLSGPRFQGKTPPFRDVNLRTDASMGTVVEVADCHVMPFEFQEVSHIVWRNMTNTSGTRHRSPKEEIQLTGETLVKRFEGLMLSRQPNETVVRGLITLRRFNEDHRTVIVATGIIDPQEVGTTAMNGVKIRQSGVYIVEPVVHKHAWRNKQSATLLRSFHTASPEVDDDIQDRTFKVGVLTNFVLHSLDFHLDMKHQVIENILLREGDTKVGHADTTGKCSP